MCSSARVTCSPWSQSGRLKSSQRIIRVLLLEKEDWKDAEQAQQQIEALSSESEAHDKEINRLNDKITSVRRSTHERLGRGKEVFDLISTGGKLPPSADDENSLIEYYSVSHYATFHEWTTGYDHLTARLYTYLILQDMGKQDDDIAAILCISPSAVRSIKSRVKARKKSNP